MLTVSHDQIARMQDARRREYCQELVAHCRARLPVVTAALRDAELARAVTDGVARAQRFGFERRGGTRLVVESSLLFGCGFADDPLHPWAAPALATPHFVVERRRARKLHDAMQGHIAGLLRGSSESPAELVSTLRRFLARDTFEIPTATWATDLAALLETWFRRQTAAAPPGACLRLVRHIGGRASALSLKTPDDAAHCVALQIGFGHRWYEDPALPWLQRALAQGGMVALRQAALSYLPEQGASPR